MKTWLLGIVYAAVISSAALAIVPAGRVKGVTRLCCGILCAMVMCGPLLKLDMDALSVSIAAYEQAAEAVVETAGEEARTEERTYIEEKCAAYILGKATGAGAAVTAVSVSARWDGETGVWYPWSALVTGRYSASVAAALEADLGIPAQRQTWEEALDE